jgi:hypothetical protein
MRKFAIAALAATALAGCASKSNEITAAYISPVQYQNYDCRQLAMEAQALSSRAAIVSGAQDQKRTNDQLATAAAVVVFWPAAFFVGGDGPTAAELGNLKGQLVAVEQASIMKRCNIQFQGQRPPGTEAPPQAGGEFVCEDGSLAQSANACPAPPKRPAKANPKAKAKSPA